jgi:hypothetical protein
MTMHFDFVPDNQAIIAILKAHVQGPYRVVHHALMPYVRIAPSTAGESITVRSGPQLRLMRTDDQAKELSGRDDVCDFAVIFQGSGVVLNELGRRATMLDSIDPAHPLSHRPPLGHGVPRRSFSLGTPQAQETPEGGFTATPSTPPIPTPQPQLVIAPAPVPPPTVEAPVPALLETVRQAEDVHPDLGDYVVIPEHSISPEEPLPPWAVRSPHVETIHVHKPREQK